MHRTLLHTQRTSTAALLSARPSAVARIKHTLARILVPVDGSRASLAGVEYLIDHRPAECAEIHLLNVQAPIRAGNVTPLVSAGMTYAARLRAGTAALRSARERLARAGIECVAEVHFGPVPDTILAYAAERRCTLVVMGVSGKGRLARFIRGSVSSEVVRLARTPVVLLNRNDARRSAFRPRRTALREPREATARPPMKPAACDASRHSALPAAGLYE